MANSVNHDRLLRIANGVDPDQTVPENNSVDFDPDQTAENGEQCRLWSYCLERMENCEDSDQTAENIFRVEARLRIANNEDTDQMLRMGNSVGPDQTNEIGE